MNDLNLLTPIIRETLIKTLEKRFTHNMNRHKGIEWNHVLERLQRKPMSLWSLNEMESTGGEPDVIGLDDNTGALIFCDCSPESPKGRRSVCYDKEALESRKEHKPQNSAVEMAEAMGALLLTEKKYRELQELESFDTKSSSWIQTPAAIRNLGGALFCDRRYNQVFHYHNGAESYYAARGFRCMLMV